ncbi:MAG: proline--tRNA ligase [Calditrichota bacterium]
MGKKAKTAINPTREQNYAEWYQQVVRAADLAENSPVRGCMVIKPWGYSLWENMQQVLDRMFKETGHKNAYFPLFIPKSYLEKEAEHVEGFAKECAVVTHHRLEDDGEGGLKPAGELEEPLVVRPTSETIIGEMFAKWVQSYRDLPLLINQWANVVRWEMRTRLFLRTTEFLWQEGHTAHASEQEAEEETRRMLDTYATFAEEYMALPVLKGEKTPGERFPGAVRTYCIEAMMQDGKALQAGTSHFLGQNFAKASQIKFLNKEGVEEFAYTTSWGVSTRLIGALVMAHSDDDGMVIPPKIAPAHAVILPIIHDEEKRDSILDYCDELARDLQQQSYAERNLVVEVDYREGRGGQKFWSWVKKGVPVRIEIGQREMEAGLLSVGRRDREHRERNNISREELLNSIVETLDDIQQSIRSKAENFRSERTVEIDDRDEFYTYFKSKSQRPAGFALAHWDGTEETEEKIKADLGVTIRCIPWVENPESGKCIITGKPSAQRVVFAKAY